MHAPVTRTVRTSTSATPRPRWVSLWQRLGTLRAQLRERDHEVREIDALFAREIAPRERQLTDAVLALGEALVERCCTTSLEPGDAALLGLWISETLARLQDHPFVAEERLQRLRARWRRTVVPGGPGRCPELEGADADLARSSATCRNGSGDRKRSTAPHRPPHASPHDRLKGPRNTQNGRDERVDPVPCQLGTSTSVSTINRARSSSPTARAAK